MGPFHLTDRAVLGLTGPDARPLLQDTLTQDINRLEQTPLLYTALLSPQGKLLHDAFIWQDNDWLYLDVHQPRLMALAASLHRYCVGLNVDFHDLTNEVQIYATLKDGQPDPRLQNLGCRLYTRTPQPAAAPVAAYHAHRVSLGVPDPALEAAASKALPAELHLHHLDALSFTKGCYVGQEVTTRLHTRGTPKKYLYLADYAGTAPPGTPVLAGSATVGWLGSHSEGKALATVQTRATGKDLIAGDKPLRNLHLPAYVESSEN
jgi:hypothetical protein